MKYLMKTAYSILFITCIAIFLSGCSASQDPHLSVLPPAVNENPFNYQTEFPQIPSQEEQDRIRYITTSIMFDPRLPVFEESISLMEDSDVRFLIKKTSNQISIENRGHCAFDVRINIDSINPRYNQIDGFDIFADGSLGLDFGIIPAHMSTASREINLPSGIKSLSAHIEYCDRAYIENDRIRLHSSPFRKNVKTGKKTKAVVADTVLVGCDFGLKTLYSSLIEHNLLLIGLIEPLGLYEVRIIDGRDPYDVVMELNYDPVLNHCEVESLVFPAYFPNDPIYDPVQPDDNRWAFERIRAVDAWDYFKDDIIDQSGDALVSNTVFAILDTGLSYHNDLALDSNDISLISAYGKNFVSPGLLPLDSDGHGTSVAGIMGAMGNNGIGISGMAWDPYFLPIKVFSESDEYGQTGPLFGVLQGLMYVRDLAGVAPFLKFIVNMSLGGYEQTPSYWTTEAINRVNQLSNVILVAGCGNDKNDNGFAGVPFLISADKYYPAALDSVISVGASSRNMSQGRDEEVFEEDSYLWGTNWGHTVDFCAPGSLSIYTTSSDAPNQYNSDFGGTSASCAFVSGLAALVWSRNPSFTKENVRSRIIESCVPMSLPIGKIGRLGAGRVDAFLALRGNRPQAVINNISWTRSGNPIFGDTLHLSGDGIFVDPGFIPDPDDNYNFRWYVDNNFHYPVALGREAIYYKLTPGHHTIHLVVWNKNKEWDFSDIHHFSEPVEWPGGIDVEDSALPSDYFELIHIPGGDFTMGIGLDDPNYSNPGSDDEKPPHIHYVESFWIRKYEVTNIEFNAFMEGGGYDNEEYWHPEGWITKNQFGWEHPLNWLSGNDNGGNPIDFPETVAHPVNGISWWEADAFCTWIDLKLPIEAQWEKAARGTSGPVTYPWGNDWEVEYCNNSADSIITYATGPVGTYSPQGDSPYGLCDCAGNVWEWCWEWYDANIYTRYEQGDYTLPVISDSKCCRGGGWYHSGSWVTRCSSRYSTALPSTTRYGYIGFRPIGGAD